MNMGQGMGNQSPPADSSPPPSSRTHFVGENAVTALVPVEDHPVDALELVVAELPASTEECRILGIGPPERDVRPDVECVVAVDCGCVGLRQDVEALEGGDLSILQQQEVEGEIEYMVRRGGDTLPIPLLMILYRFYLLLHPISHP